MRSISCTAGRNDENAFRNVMSFPPNCPSGQAMINGICRDIWLAATTSFLGVPAEDLRSVVETPPNCPPGQHLVNGRCQEVWRSSNIMNTIIENWRNMLSKRIQNEDSKFHNENPDIESRDVVKVPLQCPIGYKADALGNCRKRLEN